MRPASSAVNKQPWLVVICDRGAHFYEKRSKGYVSADNRDIRKIDMGIALCHFELAAIECGLSAAFRSAIPASRRKRTPCIPQHLPWIEPFRTSITGAL